MTFWLFSTYIFIIHLQIHTDIHVNEIVEIVDPTAIIHIGILYILPKGKSSFDSNLIFMKFLPYLNGLPPVIVSI